NLMDGEATHLQPRVPEKLGPWFEGILESIHECGRMPGRILDVLSRAREEISRQHLEEHDRLGLEALFGVLVDVVQQGWILDKGQSGLIAYPPDANPSRAFEQTEVKRRLRAGL